MPWQHHKARCLTASACGACLHGRLHKASHCASRIAHARWENASMRISTFHGSHLKQTLPPRLHAPVPPSQPLHALVLCPFTPPSSAPSRPAPVPRPPTFTPRPPSPARSGDCDEALDNYQALKQRLDAIQKPSTLRSWPQVRALCVGRVRLYCNPEQNPGS